MSVNEDLDVVNVRRCSPVRFDVKLVGLWFVVRVCSLYLQAVDVIQE